MLAAAQRGERDALEALLRHQQPAIHAVCRRITGNDTDAADATQDALIAIVKGLPRFDGRSAFSTWVYRVATNAALDEVRRRGRRPVAVVDTESDRASAARHRANALGDDPANRVSDCVDLDRALQQLPLDFRAPVVLRDLLGLDYAEIASVLGIPAGTVRSRISRGRAALARALPQPIEGPAAGNWTRPTDVEEANHHD